MDPVSSQDLLNKALNDERPFVCYKKPNADKVVVRIQKDQQIADFNDGSQKGFLFAPFDFTNKTLFIPESNTEYVQWDLLKDAFVPASETGLIENISAADKHKSLVKDTIRFIKQGKAHKIVVSRKEKVKSEPLSLVTLFQSMASAYPNAFVYLWYHPYSGVWAGASPETLIHCKDGKFKTMALAGTRSITGANDVPWGQKEIREQQLVVDQIIEKLKGVPLNISDRTTRKAGGIEHLCTNITGVLGQDLTLKKLVEVLHPTAAICGLPTQIARDFILENEGYEREYYTGYLGEWIPNQDGSSEAALYVNLRCMKIEGSALDAASVYVGGGITAQSDPHDEWEETVEKSKVMKRFLSIKTTSSN